jgi:hypothetical protein
MLSASSRAGRPAAAASTSGRAAAPSARAPAAAAPRPPLPRQARAVAAALRAPPPRRRRGVRAAVAPARAEIGGEYVEKARVLISLFRAQTRRNNDTLLACASRAYARFGRAGVRSTRMLTRRC